MGVEQHLSELMAPSHQFAINHMLPFVAPPLRVRLLGVQFPVVSQEYPRVLLQRYLHIYIARNIEIIIIFYNFFFLCYIAIFINGFPVFVSVVNLIDVFLYESGCIGRCWHFLLPIYPEKKVD